jgi:hypothetical protein
MDLTTKKFKIEKTKNFIKHYNLFIFLNGINRNSNDWILIEQELKKINFNYYKIFNKTSKTTLNSSIFLNTSSLINSMTFLLKPTEKKDINKNILFNRIEALIFSLLAVKINNKIYSKPQLKTLISFNYKNNKLLFYKFLISNTKTIFKKMK